MKINTFSQQGKRSNNEDYKGYNERLWMVCDGVGGHVSGERASKFVVETMLKYFQKDIPDLNKNGIQERLIQVQKDLNAILDNEPELEKMGTTFTGVFKTDAYWYAAHLGDSRIYLFRPSEQKLWHTWDHSLVGELMKNKDITLEDGRHHPLSNRIQKAIIANFEGKTNNADIVKLDDLRQGDLFLLCSDGVIEAWSDLEFVNLFSDKQLTFEEKCKKLQEQCEQLSKDNNTALLIEIEAEDTITYGNGKNEELRWTTFQDIQNDYQEYLDKQKEEEETEATEEKREEVNSVPEIEVTELEIDNTTGSQEEIPIIELTNENVSTVPEKSKKKQWIFIVIAAFLLVLILSVIARGGLEKNQRKAKPITHETEQVKQKKGQQTSTATKKASTGKETVTEPKKEETTGTPEKEAKPTPAKKLKKQINQNNESSQNEVTTSAETPVQNESPVPTETPTKETPPTEQ